MSSDETKALPGPEAPWEPQRFPRVRLRSSDGRTFSTTEAAVAWAVPRDVLVGHVDPACPSGPTDWRAVQQRIAERSSILALLNALPDTKEEPRRTALLLHCHGKGVAPIARLLKKRDVTVRRWLAVDVAKVGELLWTNGFLRYPPGPPAGT